MLIFNHMSAVQAADVEPARFQVTQQQQQQVVLQL
jgi:hypothetical protein